MPALLRPAKGRHGLVDHEKMFCPVVANGQDIFDLRGIDRGHGCVVIVRPDQHVAHVLSLEDHAGIADFFSAFMLNGQQAVPRRDGASKAPLGFSQQPAL